MTHQVNKRPSTSRTAMVATTQPPAADQQPQPTNTTTESLPDLRILKVPVVESAFQVRVGVLSCVCASRFGLASFPLHIWQMAT